MLDSGGARPAYPPVQTQVWKVSPLSPDPAIVQHAAEQIRAGGLVAFPTETVYGLGADALNAGAVTSIFQAKGRPANNPVIVHVADRTQLMRLVAEWPEEAELLTRYFWPGPLTLVLPRRPSVPDNVTAGADTVGVRVPDHPVALALLAAARCPIAAPSANLSNSISPTTAKHVLKSLDGRISGILDGGACTAGIESTVLSLVSEPTILRHGIISRASLEAVLGRAVKMNDKQQGEVGEPLPSPGQLARHYAPTTPLELVEGSAWFRVERLLEGGKKVGWLTFGLAAAQGINHPRLVVRPMPGDPAGYASRLYAALHDLDAEGLDYIICAAPPDREAWAAVRDRLRRASA
jgi:L-threonylcarbamoyladenylate synthase